MRSPTLLLLAACAREEAPAPPPSPTVALVLPLAEGGEPARAQVQAVELALDGRYALLPVEDAGPATVAALAARPEVVGALAHASTAAADASQAAWSATDLPVLSLAPASSEGLARLVPSPDELARCAVALIEGRRVVVVHDASAEGMALAARVQEGLGARAWTLLALDPADLATDLGRLRDARPDAVVYAGAVVLGADLLRALRAQGQRTPFLALGAAFEAPPPGADASFAELTVIAPHRAPFLADALGRYTAATGHAPSGAERDAYDAAIVLGAALDVVPRDARGLPARADTRAALSQVIGVGLGGPLALVEGRPTPIQCTASARRDGTLAVLGAAQIGMDGEVTRLGLARAQ